MNWIRKISCGGSGRGGGREEMRERLIQHQQQEGGGGCVPRGCVAVVVGGEEEPEERVVVDVRALAQPCGREFGYGQKGVLRIPCAADEFRRAVAADSHRCTTRRR